MIQVWLFLFLSTFIYFVPTVQIKNIPQSISDAEVKEAFSAFGAVTDYHFYSAPHKQYRTVYISYNSEEDANKAKENKTIVFHFFYLIIC